VAWNKAAARIFTDYGAVPAESRNILRMLFGGPKFRDAAYDWEAVARHVVGSFRIDAARAGVAKEVQPLIDELCGTSARFAALWHDHDLPANVAPVKTLDRPAVGPIMLEYSGFAVDGRQDLYMIVYNPATPSDEARVRRLVEGDG
jgi:hypothetical protein